MTETRRKKMFWKCASNGFPTATFAIFGHIFFHKKNHIGYFPWDPHEYELLIWLRNKTFGSQWSSIFHTRKHFGHFPRPREKDPYEYELLIWNKAASGFPSFIVRCGDVFIHISNCHYIGKNLGIDEKKVLISVDTRGRADLTLLY